ncbi:FMN-dependent NADH-azoreductase [Pseudomonas sp. Pseusp122]|uniref:FMN-dependent NADH-azoreductase n=1 Tax=unclassified Pseudomonas TaxID=196821 RepID=UPI0039A4508B
MRNVLLLSASPNQGNSPGFRLAAEMVGLLQQRFSGLTLVHRDLAAAPLSPITEDYAGAIIRRAPIEDAAFTQSEGLISELERSDLVFITTPIHNFTGPAALKLWIDHVVRAHRTFENGPAGKQGLLEDRPVYLLISSGGVHRGPMARQQEFITPYLRHVLNSIGLFDLHFIYLQGMVGGEEAVATAVDCARGQLLLEPLFARRPRAVAMG